MPRATHARHIGPYSVRLDLQLPGRLHWRCTRCHAQETWWIADSPDAVLYELARHDERAHRHDLADGIAP